jgi:hypothetical protein
MKNIQPLDIWSDGITKTATCIKLYLTYDDLATQAALHYSLCDDNGTTIYEGQIFIAGQEYIDWGTSGDSNNEAYVIAANKLNLTLIP